ncbi:MAG: D-alanyl-D-alanine carboxypeptidase, partial [Chloroflexi bacterium]|nr:D-alanyl-D-alanine carboxypeptidase [Chloroflexota bacterium]
MRRIIATILLMLALEVAIIAPLLTFTPTGKRVFSDIFPSPTPSPTPILTVRGTPPPISATAAYLLDADTGHMLVNINGQQRLPMASTTKIMTAIITIEKADLNQIVTIKQDAIDEVQKNFGSSAQLVVGDKIRLKDLLYGLLLPSGDDAAIAIADAVGGTTANFVNMMNLTARQLHLTQTHYINPDGLTYKTPQGQPDPNHYTTASDLAQLAHYALNNQIFAQIVQLQRYVLPASPDHHAYVWDTTNNLLSTYAGATGVKTGYTVEAGYVLVFSATNANHHLIGVVMQEKDDKQ